MVEIYRVAGGAGGACASDLTGRLGTGSAAANANEPADKVADEWF